MKSSFSYIYIAHETKNCYGSPDNYGDIVSSWISVAGIPFAVSSTTTKVLTVINGLDFYNDPIWIGGGGGMGGMGGMGGSSNADHFSINVYANLSSGVLTYGYETVVIGRSCYLYYLAVDFIVYDWSNMKTAQSNQ